ncbi:MAG: TonB-dependent receptor domain-containing protein, partial [bacterium]
MDKKIIVCMLCLPLGFLLFIDQLPAGTTGKLAGKVTDAQTGEALPGANIVLEGTMMGAAADADGKYVVLNLSPGVYSVRATMMGYSAASYKNVRVSIDLTTTLNFQLNSEILELGEGVTVIAKRELVQKDLTASTAVVGTEEISTLPIAELQDAIELQAGIISREGNLHIRGGRAGEVGFWIDGIPVTDVYDGKNVIEFNKDAVQELQVITGAFNAEYGQAQSGIINIATKEGNNDFGGSLTLYSGDHFGSNDDIFFGIDNVAPVNTRNFEFALHGPILKDKLFYYVNARYINRGGWVSGRRKFRPDFILRDVETDERGRPLLSADSTFRLIPADSSTFGDNALVDMNGSKELFTQAKLVYRLTPAMKLAYTYLRSEKDFREFSPFNNERSYILNPDGAIKKFRDGNTHIAKLTHVLSSRTFYDIGFSFFSKKFEAKLFDDLKIKTDASGNPITLGEGGILVENPNRYVDPNLQLELPFSFKMGGTDNRRFQRKTETLLGKIDLTSQVTNNHQVKSGIEFRRHQVFFDDFELQPVGGFDPSLEDDPYVDFQIPPMASRFHDRYEHKPIEFSAYLQDKMEFESMTVNIGVRFDYFDPDGVILADPSDPNVDRPIKPSHKFDDLNGDGIQDPGERTFTLDERRQFWFKRAGSKTRISPRIGIAFPVTDRGVFHFSYGHFIQIPNFERLYQNPEFELEPGEGTQTTIGNADLSPEFTISGEIGLQQQIGEDIGSDVTIFFRDIRDLAGTSSEEISVFGAGRYSRIVNSDFGFVRGIVLSASKRFVHGFSANVDYTFQIAKATNSDPEKARRDRAQGREAELQLTNTDWDQLHTFNATLSYSKPHWGGSLIFQYGSGQPFTPREVKDVSTLLTNSERKPEFKNVDARFYYNVPFGGDRTARVFLRIFNLFDT